MGGEAGFVGPQKLDKTPLIGLCHSDARINCNVWGRTPPQTP
jgi:hypothetical protein